MRAEPARAACRRSGGAGRALGPGQAVLQNALRLRRYLDSMILTEFLLFLPG
jgi:hypothetical protein